MNRKCLTFLYASIQGAGRASDVETPPQASAAPSAGAEGTMSPPPRPAGSQPGPPEGASTQPAPLPVSIYQMYYPYRMQWNLNFISIRIVKSLTKSSIPMDFLSSKTIKAS